MNEKKKYVTEVDLKTIAELTEKTLRIWATLYVYKYFKKENKPLTAENENLFVLLVEKQYRKRFQLFVDKL